MKSNALRYKEMLELRKQTYKGVLKLEDMADSLTRDCTKLVEKHFKKLGCEFYGFIVDLDMGSAWEPSFRLVFDVGSSITQEEADALATKVGGKLKGIPVEAHVRRVETPMHLRKGG